MKTKCIILIVFLIVNLSFFKTFAQKDSTELKNLFAMSFEDLLNQTVVTASKYEQTTLVAPSAVTIVTATDIKNFGYNSLAELINSQKGYFISYDRDYAYIGNRGFLRSADYNNRNLLLINGHTMNENFYGSALMESALCLNMNYIDHVEIIRGPGSSMYGNNAMLNVFNIITKKGAGIDGFNISATYGSFNKREISVMGGKLFKSGLEMSIGAIASKTDGPDLYFPEIDTSKTNNGISKGMDWEKLYGVYSTIGYKDFNLNLALTNREKGVPTGSYGADLTGKNSSLDSHYFVEAKYSSSNEKGVKLNIRSFIDGYFYKGITPYDGILNYAETDGNWAGTEAQAYLKIKELSVITGGVEYKYNWRATRHEWDNEQIYSHLNKEYSIFSLYAQSETSILKNLLFTAGIRYDNYSNVEPALSPRLSLVYQFKQYSSIKLLFGHAFRAPNVYENLFASPDVQNSNSGLKPERNIMYELAFEHRFNQILTMSASAYQYTLKNLIDMYLDPSSEITQFRNIGLTRGYGFESGLQLMTKKTMGYLNFSIQKSHDHLTEKDLTNSPRFICKTGITHQLFSFLKVSPEVFYESGRLTVYETRSSPVFFTNINFVTKQFYDHFDVAFKVRNVFNQKYGYPGGFEHVQEVIIQDGINFSIQLNARF